MSQQIRIDGTWIASIGAPGDLAWSTVADGDSEQASWRMDLPPGFLHPVLVEGALVEVFDGPWPVFCGEMAEPKPDDEGWTFTAAGIAAQGQGYLCLDDEGNTASNPDEVLDAAIARGLQWIRSQSISAEDFAATGSTDSLNTVNALMNEWALTESVRWGVDTRRQVYKRTDPTEPMWHLTPGSGKVGRADDDYASDLYVRYKAGVSTYATVHVSDTQAASKRHVEAPVDATNLGVISSGRATDVGEGLLTRGKARYAPTDAMTLSPYQITTLGGRPAYLPFVRAGQVARLHGVLNEQGLPTTHVDFVIGRTEYRAGERSIEIAPVGLAARTLTDVLQVATA